MRRTRVKICGVMRPEDAAMAAACGADAVGMIFHAASARNVSVEKAGQILAALPAFVTPVGLFVDAGAEEIREVCGRLGLRHVQLHGDEGPELVEALGGLVVLKAIRVESTTFARSLDRFRGLANLRGIVLETGGTDRPGGTGVENNWDAIREAKGAGAFSGLPAVIAAGGLKPGNVGSVVRALRPWAVDVSSGVERVRGEKSEKLAREFIEQAERADRDAV